MKTTPHKLDLVEKLILTGLIAGCLLVTAGFTTIKVAQERAEEKLIASIKQQMQDAKTLHLRLQGN